MMSLEEAIKHCEEVAEELDAKVPYKIFPDDTWTEEQTKCHECASEHRQLAEWLKRLKRIEDYIAEGKDDIECDYSLCFYEIEAVMNGEI